MQSNPYEGTTHVGATTGEEQPTRVRWIIFGLACATSWLLYLHRYSWGVIKPFVKQELGYSDVELGLLDSAFSAPYAIGQIPAGALGDVFGARAVLSAIILLWSGCLAWLGLASSSGAISASRGAMGAAQAGCYPILAQVTRRWFPASIRTSVQGAVAAFSGRMGGCSAWILLPPMLVWMSWRNSMFVLSTLGVVLAIVLWMLFRNSPAEHPGANAAERKIVEAGSPPEVKGKLPRLNRSLANGANIVMLLFHSMTSTFADMLYVNWIGSYLVEEKGMTPGQLIIGMLPLLGGALGGLLGGALNDVAIRRTGNRRWSRSIVGMTGKVISAGIIVWAVTIEDGRWVMAALFFCKFFTDWSQPTQWGTLTDIAGKASGTAFGVMNTVGSMAGIAAGPAIGYVLQHHGWDAVFNVIGLVYLVSGLSWLFIDCTRPLFREE